MTQIYARIGRQWAWQLAWPWSQVCNPRLRRKHHMRKRQVRQVQSWRPYVGT